MPSLVEIDPLVLEEKILDFVNVPILVNGANKSN